MVSKSVHLPGSEVYLILGTAAEQKLYNNLVLQGGRFVASSLAGPGGESVAAYGTLLYLEDLKELPENAGRQAEHRAVGRICIKRFHLVSNDPTTEVSPKEGYWEVEAELLDDHILPPEESEQSQPLLEVLRTELQEIKSLQDRVEGSEVSASQLIADLSLRQQAPWLEAVQGLWRTKSGQQIRVDGDKVKGVGLLQKGAEENEIIMKIGTKEFKSQIEGGVTSPVAQSLTWSDDDIWTRVARPPPYQYDDSSEVGSFWRVAQRWQALRKWQAEARRGEAWWKSAEAIAQSLEQAETSSSFSSDSDASKQPLNEEEAVEKWEREARKAELAAAEECWEEALEPAQTLLQAASHAERVELFRQMLQREKTRQQLRLALGNGSSNASLADNE
eukprot:TRINITY_DN15561_c0_g3_i1.p1 TRINITY_DN15561_c0_g3~~TRINITY_DN15561_c0_g3_i1.p1  ORF type:complete len:390 (+),score=96.88 TRINITY_DN15561_c0_g3_i1:1-1170(+)